MKILMINVVCGIRSTGRICTDLADALTAQGHDVKIAYGREDVPQQYRQYAIKIGSDRDVKLHGVKARLLDRAGFGSEHATKKFIAWVREYDPDVIHLHNLHGYYIHIALLFDYLRTCGKKIIWTLHDCWAFTGHCAHFAEVKCSQWQTGCLRCPQKKEYPASLFADQAKKNWNDKKRLFTGIKGMTIVTPSHWLAGLVKQSFLKQYAVKVIQNGIDTSVFRPTPSDFRVRYGLEGKNIVLGAAAVWNHSKGLDDFIRLSELLDETYKIVLVGLSEKQIRTIPESILGITRTDSARELAEIYSAADVFVNPSRQETMGLTTVEAYACGTPVIVSDLTAVPEVVNARCGLVLNCIDAAEIKKAIDTVLTADWTGIEKEAEYFKQSARCRAYIAQCYSG